MFVENFNLRKSNRENNIYGNAMLNPGDLNTRKGLGLAVR